MTSKVWVVVGSSAIDTAERTHEDIECRVFFDKDKAEKYALDESKASTKLLSPKGLHQIA